MPSDRRPTYPSGQMTRRVNSPIPNCSAAVGAILAYGSGWPEPAGITKTSSMIGCAYLGANKPAHSRECFCGNPRATDEQRSVAGPVGQFMQHARSAIGKMDLNCVREALTRRQFIVPGARDNW